MAKLLYNLGKASAAWELLEQESGLRRDRRLRLLGSLTEVECYRYLARASWILELELSLASELKRPGVEKTAYEQLLSWKGQVGKMLIASRDQLLAGSGGEQRDRLASLRRVQSELSNLAFATNVRDRKQHEARCARLIEQRNRLELELRRSLEGSEAGEELRFEALRRGLPVGSAVLDFFVHRPYRPARRAENRVVERGSWGAPHLSVWITRPGFPEPVRLDLGAASAIEKSVRIYLEMLIARDATSVEIQRYLEPSAARLRALLWEPLVPYLDEVAIVFVSPDGCLGAFPFETLLLGDATYLIGERYGARTRSAGTCERRRILSWLRTAGLLARLAGRPEDPGDAEVEQLRLAVCGHEDVARLQVSMHDRALAQVEVLLDAVAIDRPPRARRAPARADPRGGERLHPPDPRGEWRFL